MEMDIAKFNEKLAELLAQGRKKKNILEYQEISDCLQDMPLDAEQMDKVFDYLENNGIDVLRMVEPEKEPDVLLLSDDDEINLEEEEEVDVENIDLSVPEGISIEDPVRMYLKEIGKVPLLLQKRRSSWRGGWKKEMKKRRSVWLKPICVSLSASRSGMWDAVCCSWI